LSEKLYRFVRWGEGKRYAVLYDTDMKLYVIVPFSRLIPHPVCEDVYRSLGYKDPNIIAERCAEEGSVFGIAVFRHELHLLSKYNNTYVREPEKEYFFPRTIDFSCVRECILKGKDTDQCIRECS